jgi:hypothetical protein
VLGELAIEARDVDALDIDLEGVDTGSGHSVQRLDQIGETANQSMGEESKATDLNIPPLARY